MQVNAKSAQVNASWMQGQKLHQLATWFGQGFTNQIKKTLGCLGYKLFIWTANFVWLEIWLFCSKTANKIHSNHFQMQSYRKLATYILRCAVMFRNTYLQHILHTNSTIEHPVGRQQQNKLTPAIWRMIRPGTMCKYILVVEGTY